MVKLDLDLDPDPDLHSEKLLDPDLDPHKMNADPQPCPLLNQVSSSVAEPVGAGTFLVGASAGVKM